MGFWDSINPFSNSQPNQQYVINPQQFGTQGALGQQIGGLMGQGSPYTQTAQVGADPYGGDWRSLVSQLQGMANGTGPSLAEQAYRQASQDSMGQLSGMAQGSATPGAAREAMLQQGRIGQGMSAGLAQARTGEQMGAIGQLGSALSGAGNSAFQRDALNAQLQQQGGMANQQAWLQMMANQLGLSQQQLQAMLGNQSYSNGALGQTTPAQRGWGAISGLAAGIGKL